MKEFIIVSGIFKMSHPWSHPQGEHTGVKTNAGKAEGLQGVETVSAEPQSTKHLTLPIPAPGGGWTLSLPAQGEGCKRSALGIGAPARNSAVEGLRVHPQEEMPLS